MDYNEKKEVKVSLGDLEPSIFGNYLDTANIMMSNANYWFDGNNDLWLRNKKYPIKSGKYSEFASLELVRVGSGHELIVMVGVIVTSDKLILKRFTVKPSNNTIAPFLDDFLNKFKVKKLYVDDSEVSMMLKDELTYLGYCVDEHFNLLNYKDTLITALNNLKSNSIVKIMSCDGEKIYVGTKPNLDTIKNYEMVKIISNKYVNDTHYIILDII